MPRSNGARQQHGRRGRFRGRPDGGGEKSSIPPCVSFFLVGFLFLIRLVLGHVTRSCFFHVGGMEGRGEWGGRTGRRGCVICGFDVGAAVNIFFSSN